MNYWCVKRFCENEGGVDTKHRPALEIILTLRRARDAAPEDTVIAWPTPAEPKRAGKAGIEAKLKQGTRRHATWAASEIISVLDQPSPSIDSAEDDADVVG
jgi:transposase IS116/IS110/IS902 family protein